MVICAEDNHHIHGPIISIESHDKIFMFQVAELVTSEFFEQGDRERSELKLTPSVSSSSYYLF